MIVQYANKMNITAMKRVEKKILLVIGPKYTKPGLQAEKKPSSP